MYSPLMSLYNYIFIAIDRMDSYKNIFGASHLEFNHVSHPFTDPIITPFSKYF